MFAILLYITRIIVEEARVHECFKNAEFVKRLKEHWKKNTLTSAEIATALNREFKTSITGTTVRGKIRPLKLTIRTDCRPKRLVGTPVRRRSASTETSQKKKNVVEVTPSKEYAKPSLPFVPQSRFIVWKHDEHVE